MTAFVALLRAVNVGGNNLIRMAALKALCEELGFGDVATLLQSGNVVFTAKGTDRSMAKSLADAIGNAHGLRTTVMIRTATEMAEIVRRNPFRAEAKSDPGHLVVAFLAETPDGGAKNRLADLKVGRERTALSGREVFIHYPDGIGRSKLTGAVLERALGGVPATGRNWNTVNKLRDMAESIG